MKKMILTSCVVLSIISCNKVDTTPKHPNSEIKTVDSTTLKVNEAKSLIIEAGSYIKESINGRISVKEANKKADPLMLKYEKIEKSLPVSEQKKLQNFRISEANKMMELQLQKSR